MELTDKDKTLIIIGIVICLGFAVLSPFIASGNPDGLEKTAEDADVGEDVESPILESPFPDYTYEPLDKIGEIGVLFLGAIITLGLGFGMGILLKKRE